VQVILEDFETVKTAIYVVWPPTKIPLVKTKLFTEFLAASASRRSARHLPCREKWVACSAASRSKTRKEKQSRRRREP